MTNEQSGSAAAPDDMSILIINGLRRPPIGREIYDACLSNKINAHYIDAGKLKRRLGYKLLKSIKKAIYRMRGNTAYCSVPRLSRASQNQIADYILSNKPDIVMVIGFSYPFLHKNFFKNLQKQVPFMSVLMDTEFGNFTFDYPKFSFYVTEEIHRYDKVITFSRRVAEFLEGKQDVVMGPVGYPVLPPPREQTVKYDICFFGGVDVRRSFMLEKLKGRNLIVYGAAWEKYRPFLSRELMDKIVTENIYGEGLQDLVAQSKIILNITSSSFYSLDAGVSQRIHLVLAMQGFLLTDYCSELEDLFTIGEEIEVFRSQEEMIDKIDFYLKHDELRKKIARQGHEKFLKCFTWESRIPDFFKQISLKS
jgi:spore maturation protein CgeB